MNSFNNGIDNFRDDSMLRLRRLENKVSDLEAVSGDLLSTLDFTTLSGSYSIDTLLEMYVDLRNRFYSYYPNFFFAQPAGPYSGNSFIDITHSLARSPWDLRVELFITLNTTRAPTAALTLSSGTTLSLNTNYVRDSEATTNAYGVVISYPSINQIRLSLAPDGALSYGIPSNATTILWSHVGYLSVRINTLTNIAIPINPI